MRKITIIHAIREALVEEMKRDETVFLLGESIQGGVYPHTEGLVQEFGSDRVMDTPLAETGIVGAAIGSALAGYRPVADLMYADFLHVAADEIVKAGQWRLLHGGKLSVPAVFLAGNGGGLMIANDHSKMMTGFILHIPGIKLVVPSTPYDTKGLLKTAIRDNNPVVFFWHKNLFMEKGNVPEDEYTIPFGVADVKRQGTDVTVVATSMMVKLSLQVAEKLEGQISVEVIDPRTLEPLDLETILKSVEKTMRLVIVDEDNERCGFAAELSAQIMEKGFDLLDAPVTRVCAANYPIPGGYLEKNVLPGVESIQAAIEKIAG
jgi:pyruvate/2-oxoglutarate/acetoin dehydrogenase E1 component